MTDVTEEKRGSFKMQKHREEGHVETETGVIPTAEECRAPPKVGRGKKGSSPRVIRVSMALLTP